MGDTAGASASGAGADTEGAPGSLRKAQEVAASLGGLPQGRRRRRGKQRNGSEETSTSNSSSSSSSSSSSFALDTQSFGDDDEDSVSHLADARERTKRVRKTPQRFDSSGPANVRCMRHFRGFEGYFDDAEEDSKKNTSGGGGSRGGGK